MLVQVEQLKKKSRKPLSPLKSIPFTLSVPERREQGVFCLDVYTLFKKNPKCLLRQKPKLVQHQPQPLQQQQPVQPVKRGRGRPRKVRPVPQDSPDSGYHSANSK